MCAPSNWQKPLIITPSSTVTPGPNTVNGPISTSRPRRVSMEKNVVAGSRKVAAKRAFREWLPVSDLATERISRLKAHHHDGVLGLRNRVLEVMHDPTTLAHAAGRDDQERAFATVQSDALVGALDVLQAFEAEGVCVRAEQFLDVRVHHIDVPPISLSDPTRQRAIDKHRDRWQPTFSREVVQQIDDVLSSPETERGNDDSTADRHSLAQDAFEFRFDITDWRMNFVGVSRFGDEHVAASHDLRISQQWQSAPTEVAGKDDPPRLAIFDGFDLDDR